MMLVLSLFPGIGLLDMAFEQEGFCVVRGPDLLWGGDVRLFHPPAEKFDGVIGGPPCQAFSVLRYLSNQQKVYENLLPEFERCVAEAAPIWFLMENVPACPLPTVPGYLVRDRLYDNRWVGGEQNRLRRFSFGTHEGRALQIDEVPLVSFASFPTVRGGGMMLRRDGKPTRSDSAWHFRECVRAQGLPDDFDLPPFKIREKMQALGNGVPLPMGRAIAQAVRRACRLQDE